MEARFNLVLGNSTLDKLEWLARENDVTKGSLIRWLICAEYLRQQALLNQVKQPAQGIEKVDNYDRIPA